MASDAINVNHMGDLQDVHCIWTQGRMLVPLVVKAEARGVKSAWEGSCETGYVGLGGL